VAALISVIVTTYNRADALEAVLRSLARQTDADFEVVLADDGSTAATAELAEACKAKLGHRSITEMFRYMVGSLFNSFLFDFTEGWLYVLGVGVAAGMVRRQLDAARAGAARQT
jgi:glycosyltransferase involved in cell wall biosynthesis